MGGDEAPKTSGGVIRGRGGVKAYGKGLHRQDL